MGLKFIVAGVSLYLLSPLLPFRLSYEKGLSSFDRLIPLGTLFVAKVATIHEKLFESWVNLEQLAQLNPTRVEIVNSLVKLKGPVFIAPYSGTILSGKIFLIASATLLGMYLVHSCVKKLYGQSRKNRENSPLPLLVSVIAGAVLARTTWFQLSKVIPKTAGIFFL